MWYRLPNISSIILPGTSIRVYHEDPHDPSKSLDNALGFQILKDGRFSEVLVDARCTKHNKYMFRDV